MGIMHSQNTICSDKIYIFSPQRINLFPQNTNLCPLSGYNMHTKSLELTPPTSRPVLESEEPFVVRLLFEPSGRPDSKQDYYLTAKENLCVVCGKADSYIRWAALPSVRLPARFSRHGDTALDLTQAWATTSRGPYAPR